MFVERNFSVVSFGLVREFLMCLRFESIVALPSSSHFRQPEFCYLFGQTRRHLDIAIRHSKLQCVLTGPRGYLPLMSAVFTIPYIVWHDCTSAKALFSSSLSFLNCWLACSRNRWSTSAFWQVSTVFLFCGVTSRRLSQRS